MTLLNVTSVSKSYYGVQALKGVSFELRKSEVHALVGENGAGKSTLIKIITGATQADAGTLQLDGQLVAENNPTKSKALGIAAIYQQPALFPDLTVTENISFSLEQSAGWRLIDWRRRRLRTRELLDRIGARIDPDMPVKQLTMPQQQLVEIARALGASARILIMDEPTASLAELEVDNLFRIIRELRVQGVGIIYISHRLDELFEVADRVTVLRDGCTVASRAVAEVEPAEIIRLMIGRELSAVFPKRQVTLGDVVLETRSLGCRISSVRSVSLSVRAGEILGFFGLIGSGRTELARLLFGLTAADTGDILLRGKPVKIDTPERAVELGIAYVPEDRRHHGAILELPVAANTTLAVLRRLSRFGFLNFNREREVASAFVRQLAIKTTTLQSPVGNLSGGNQQKVALARWLATNPAVMIFDEPTQGIDVGAKSEIHRLMVDLAEKGMAILMISSDLPEILGMSDRIAVMHDGGVSGIMDRSEATQENILALALGRNPNTE